MLGVARRGRKPKSARLKLIMGNPGKKPIVPDPDIPPELPDMPTVLCEAGREEWRRMAPKLYKLGILTALDRAALAAYCHAYAHWVKCVREARDAPVRVETRYSVVSNPTIVAASRATRDLIAAAAEFGMTPSARNRIKSPAPAKDEDDTAKYFAG